MPSLIDTPRFMHLTLIIFKLSQDPEFNKQLNRQTDKQTGRVNKMLCILYTLLPIHVSSFMRLTFIYFKLSKDPEFNKQLNRQTDRERKQNAVHIVHIATYSHIMRLALIIKLSKDPDF